MDDATLHTGRILIVDDEQANVRLLERLLGRAGYTQLACTTDSRQVLPLFAAFRPDLVLLDLLMPHRDGFAVMEDLRGTTEAGPYLPVLVLTADATAETKWRALAAGATDFLTKPFDHTEVLLRIRNLLETRFLSEELRRRKENLEAEVRERTRQLLQTEKLATMGTLLAGVAHELNNPLTIVSGQAELLSMQAGGGPLEERARLIGEASQRCANIVHNFLAMARQQPPKRAHTALNDVARKAVELLAYHLRVDEVQPVFDLSEDLPPLWADRHQLHQVLVNLIVNAQQAMRATPPPRRLTLATRHDPAAGCAWITVADTGPGVPPEVRDSIFEPFFTTKPEGVGTGLGLSLCRGIIEGHGGTIRLESGPGHGAIFTIELPLGRPPAAAEDDGEPPVPARGQSILVVDDEPAVARTMADLLQLDGHRVDIVSSGAAALERLRERAYDAIFTDARMPGLDGPGLYRALEHHHPALARRLILCTGDMLTAEIRTFMRQTGVPHLGKPFGITGVRRALVGALRGSEAAPDPDPSSALGEAACAAAPAPAHQGVK